LSKYGCKIAAEYWEIYPQPDYGGVDDVADYLLIYYYHSETGDI
jgi:hypothetical protein